MTDSFGRIYLGIVNVAIDADKINARHSIEIICIFYMIYNKLFAVGSV